MNTSRMPLVLAVPCGLALCCSSPPKLPNSEGDAGDDTNFVLLNANQGPSPTAEAALVDLGEGPPSFVPVLAPPRAQRVVVPQFLQFVFERPDGSPAAGAHVFFGRFGSFVERATTNERGSVNFEEQLESSRLEIVAVLPRVGTFKCAVWANGDGMPGSCGRPRKFDGYHLRLVPDPQAALPRPRPCNPGALKDFMNAVLPDACLSQHAEELFRLPKDLRFDEWPGVGEGTLSIHDVGPNPLECCRRAATLHFREGGRNAVVTSARFDLGGKNPRRGLAAVMASLTRAFGPPSVEVTRRAGYPHGIGQCGTPVPPSATATWKFPPGEEFASVTIEAQVRKAASLQEIVDQLESFSVSLQRRSAHAN